MSLTDKKESEPSSCFILKLNNSEKENTIGGIFIMQKNCKCCGKLLDISNFNSNKNLKDGYENKCKKCRQEQRKQYTIICLICGKEFKSAKKKTKYCSIECYIKNIGKFITGEKHHNYFRVKCICSQCGKEYYRIPSAIRTNNVYCSEKCHTKALVLYNKLRKSKVKHNCEYCGKEIEVWPSALKIKKHIYCSRDCQRKGFSKYFSKENSPCWNKNISNIERIINRHYLDYNKWRINVYEKDNYICKCCGDNKGGNLNAHHIHNYSKHKELRLQVKNGITLCKRCHKKFHDIYGYNNNNLEQLNEFIKNHNVEVS